MRETWVQYLSWEDPLEKGKATHFSILAWRIPRGRSQTWLSDFHFFVKYRLRASLREQEAAQSWMLRVSSTGSHCQLQLSWPSSEMKVIITVSKLLRNCGETPVSSLLFSPPISPCFLPLFFSFSSIIILLINMYINYASHLSVCHLNINSISSTGHALCIYRWTKSIQPGEENYLIIMILLLMTS